MLDQLRDSLAKTREAFLGSIDVSEHSAEPPRQDVQRQPVASVIGAETIHSATTEAPTPVVAEVVPLSSIQGSTEALASADGV